MAPEKETWCLDCKGHEMGMLPSEEENNQVVPHSSKLSLKMRQREDCQNAYIDRTGCDGLSTTNIRA